MQHACARRARGLRAEGRAVSCAHPGAVSRAEAVKCTSMSVVYTITSFFFPLCAS